MTVVQAKRRRSAADGNVVRLNTYISPEAHARLLINSTMERVSPGLYLEQLLLAHCKDWALPVSNKTVQEKKSRRAKPDASDVDKGSASQAAPVESEPAEQAA